MLFSYGTTALTKPALAFVGTHGLTDLDSVQWVAPYAVMAVAPLSTENITALFCAASVLHFSEDCGFGVSLLVHASVLLVGLAFGVQAAFDAMLVYLVLVHTPAHYFRCAMRGRGRAALAALALGIAAAALACVLFPPQVNVPVSDGLQRLVIAHVCTEATHPHRHSNASL